MTAMPTNIVVDINDPLNADAWGLHPVPSGQWSPGNYAQGSVAVYNKSVYFAAQQTNSTPGTDATWVVLVTGTLIGVSLDTQGFVPVSQLPITRGQGMRALKFNGGTGGTAWPGAANYLKIVETALPADEGENTVLCWNDAFWPIGGVTWSFAQAALAAFFGSFSGAQLATIQSYAITMR